MKFEELFANSHINISFDETDKCAVVGNSGKLLDEENGDFIDSHDFVLRMNSAPVKGYEKFVGSKTTLRIINGTLLKGKRVEQTDTPKNWIRELRNRKILMGRTIQEGYINGIMEMVNANELYFPSDEINNIVSKLENRFRLRLASTGLYCLFFTSDFFEKVNAFGFGFHQDSLERRHYWESYDREHHVNHEWEKEERAVKRMINRNRLEMY